MGKSSAEMEGSKRVHVVADHAGDALRVLNHSSKLPAAIARWCEADGCLRKESPELALNALRQSQKDGFPEIRFSQEIEPWMENRRRVVERRELRREYELRVQRRDGHFFQPAISNVRLTKD